ncbi:hypothetical protein DOTSEDRAFT_71824 [Dothistroma septosporum NZE10]|uniref:Uncharacterized protein n=1 Tax=Dothistroma septosporum (strain NZE10 / CBS 128990) TaxID=675120 RepID=N1PNX3_DOTSN|nr:hypothetical protein DOTSEDRAFT_71824 [Dothistroma septosporum NZE10]
MATSPPPFLSQPGYNKILFQPPKSPASVTTTPSLATANDYFSTHNRKRQRPESREGRHSQQTGTPGWAQYPTPSDKLCESPYGRSSGLVNERYRLADGFDTPSLQSTARFEQLAVPEHDVRRRLRDDDMGLAMSNDSAPIAGPLARERNGVARVPAGHGGEAQRTWTSLAFGIVGSVFNFGTTVFRGFTAGGGKGYETSFPLVGSDLLQQSAGRSTPLPGSWYADEFDGDFEQDSPDFGLQQPQSRPPNKRRQTDRDSWVVIGTPDVDDGGPCSPRRKVSGGSVTRSSLTARPQASRASSRRSLAPASRRPSSYVAANGSPAQQPSSTTKLAEHSLRASVAPTRSPQGRSGSRPNSAGSADYMSPEVERYTKRQAKQDKAINSMSRRMEDMIRQAKQALGTKYTVEGGNGMDMDDEGYVDNEW